MVVVAFPALCMCRKCARISKFDLGRRYCPTTASPIRECMTRPCRFFLESEKNNGGDDVRKRV